MRPERPKDLERNWKRWLVFTLWASVGLSALEALAFLALFRGYWRMLFALPVIYGAGAWICALELRETEHPSPGQWRAALFFGALPLLVIAERVVQRFKLRELLEYLIS